MNRAYLRHDYATDVISFCLEKGENLEGEIYVNLDKTRSQARENRVSVAHELARLVVHGALHLTGYDDNTKKKRDLMKRREDELLESWFRKNGDK